MSIALLLNTQLCEEISKEMLKFKKQCNPKIIKPYGMKGQKWPRRTTMSMCPMIQRSCCSKKDQMTMYANWVHSKEKLGVQNRFKQLSLVYGKSLSLIKQTMALAKKISKKLNGKLLANCKLLSKKILMFEMDQTGVEILKAFKKMEIYMTKTYSAMYCAVCDHKNALMFDTKDDSVYYSINFCRGIVENSLIPVLYMNVHFKYVLETVTRFVSSCDFKGAYERDVKINLKHTFPIDEKIEKNLLECRNNRNKPDWFVECEPLCKEVRLDEFSTLLVPEVDQLILYNKFLDGKLKKINNEARKNPISGAGGKVKKAKKKVKKAKRVRILAAAAAAGKKGGAKPKKKKKKKKTRKIYFTAKGSYISKKTVIEFSKEGLDLHAIGKASLITEPMFNQIKNAYALKKMGAKKTSELFGVNIPTKHSALFGSVQTFSSIIMFVALAFNFSNL